MSTMINILNVRMLCTVVLLLSLTGCGSGAIYFSPTNDGLAFKSGRIAVISGEIDSLGTNYTKIVTSKLKEKTNFTVLSQEEISKKVSNYPFKIKYNYQEKSIPAASFSNQDIKMIKKIQSKLNVDYLFVVWGMNLRHELISDRYGYTHYYSMGVLGDMIQYPSGEVVAFTDFSYTRKSKLWEVLSFKKSNYYVNSLIEKAADEHVDKFVKVTASGKAK